MKRAAAVCLAVLLLVATLFVLRGEPEPDREAISAGSSSAHVAGTDELGRDRAYRTAEAFLLGMAGAIAAAALTTCVTAAAASAAVFGNKSVRSAMLYGSDLCLTLPWLFLLMLVRSALPLNLSASMSALVSFGLLAALGWPIYVRSVIASIAALQRADWLLQARCSGVGPVRTMWVQVMPHVRPILLTQFLLAVPMILIAEANLGSLGLGVSEPLVSWGSLIGEVTGASQLAATRWVYLPLAALVVTMFCMETLGAEEL